ncbi:MAG: IS4 family transposase [Cyclobacteriaceae bacterium]
MAIRHVSGSAFTQARYKIKPELFHDLLAFLTDTYKVSEKKHWKGHLLYPRDGSTLNLPPSQDIEDHFGLYATTQLGVKRYLARTLILYDVLNNFVLDGLISSMENGEKNLLNESLDKFNTNDILIIDRGFGNYCTIKEVTDRNIKFCVRVLIKNSNFAKKTIADERADFVTIWEPSAKQVENSRKNELNPSPLTVRVTKICLNTGETELLVTNLYDRSKYSSQDIDGLYQLRWGVEESFKNLKAKMKIEQFGCKKAVGVLQKFYAHVFCVNIGSLVGLPANKLIESKTSNRKWRYKYNWKNAFRYVREKLLVFLFSQQAAKTFDHLIKQISSSTTDIIPNRHFARDTTASSKKGRITQFNK